MTVRSFVHTDIAWIRITRFGSGSIVIERGPRDDAVEGTLACADQQQLDDAILVVDGDALRISLPQQRGDAQLRLGVPDGLDYLIDAGAADITLRAAAGPVRLTFGSGDISLGQVRDLTCRGGSGDIHVAEIAGQPARVETGSGEIRIGTIRAALSVKSGSGNVVITRVDGAAVHASTGSGDIAVPFVTGSVDLRTATGSVTVGVADDLPAWLDLHSGTGAVRIALAAGPEPAPGEPYATVRARTGSGEIAVYRA